MKQTTTKRTLGILLAAVLLSCVIIAAVLIVQAQNVIGLMSASYIREDEDLILFGDTTLLMDQDLTVPSIRGDYHLTIEGSGKLTVNGSGNGIDVKSLNCTSDLFIQTGWHAIEVAETVYINNAESFIVGGIYAGGHIDIRSQNATIAGNGNAIFSSLGNITLSGGTFDIGANGIAVAAETGGIYMTGAFTVNSNKDRTINADKGELVINGSLKSTSGARFDPEVSFVGRDKTSIGAMEGFFFYGTTLEVTGLGGILAGGYNKDTDISITADSVSIITERYYALNGGNIYVDSDNLWIENRGSEENENVSYTFHTIFADGDATLSSENGGIVGENCFFVDGNLTLNGNFVVGADHDSGYAMRSIGRTEVNGNLRVISEDILCVYAENGFSFNGTTLDIEGYGGIDADGGVNITADSTTIITSVNSPITSTGYAYIDSDYLFLQNLMEDELHPLADWAGISAEGDVTVISNDATIIGRFGIRVAEWLEDTDGNVYLRGNFHVIGTIDQAILCDNDVIVEGSLTAQGSVVEQGSDNPFNYGVCYAIDANRFSFNGTTLNVEGFGGIAADNIDVTADSVDITTDVGDALNGVEVYVTANYLWAENKSTKVNSDWSGQHGISAESILSLTVKGGTVIGYDDALHLYDENDQFEFHYIYVDGHLTAVSQTGAGMYAPQGNVELYGGPIVSVGETYGVHADILTFEGGSLRIDGNTGVYAISGVDLSGDDINITAFSKRNSGIWCEYGYVDLEGKVVIKTGGWYGINTTTNLSFGKGYYEISGPEGNAQAVKTGGTLFVDPTLIIAEPAYGHVNGNEIYGTGDSPAMELVMYTALGEVSLLIDGPRAGRLPAWTASGIYFLDSRISVDDIVWYEDGVEMSRDAKFIAGRRYTVKITLSANGGYYFLEGIMGKINGKNVSTGTTEKKIMYLTADLGECPKSVDKVELSITAPVEGKTPSTAVTDPASEYGVYSRDVRWGVSTDGINFVMMASGEKFVGGKYYRVFMDVNLAGNQYKFPITTATGSVQPDVISTVNGNPAVTEKAYDQDPETVITVYFDFGKCNDSVIEEVTIVDVIAPVAGEHPNYTVNMFGTGYHVDTAKNSYEDIYWKNPPEKWYYVKNGVQWWDTTTGSWEYVYENDTFLPGHTYVCQLYLCTDEGFTFANVLDLQATVNGKPAEINEGWTDSWNTRVIYTFTCEAKNVDTIMINKLDEPVVGNTPDYSASVMVPEAYMLDTSFGIGGIQWYNCEEMVLSPTDTFMPGEPYCIAIRVISVKTDGVDLVKFNQNVEFNINGTPVTQYGYWDKVVVENNVVTAYYTFRKAASAPILGANVSGSISSFGSASDDITVQLIPAGAPEPAYETIVRGNYANYLIENVPSGAYTLRVTKNGHMVFNTSIVVVGTEVTRNVTMSIAGDVDSDGDVDKDDAQAILKFITGHEIAINTDTIDVNRDGEVNIRDAAMILLFLSGKIAALQ